MHSGNFSCLLVVAAEFILAGRGISHGSFDSVFDCELAYFRVRNHRQCSAWNWRLDLRGRGKSYDEVWKAVVRTASRSFAIVESSKETGTLKAEKPAGMTTWGEVVGIFIKPTSNGAPVYAIEVQSLKRYQVQVTGQDWTTTMITGIKAELDQ